MKSPAQIMLLMMLVSTLVACGKAPQNEEEQHDGDVTVGGAQGTHDSNPTASPNPGEIDPIVVEPQNPDDELLGCLHAWPLFTGLADDKPKLVVSHSIQGDQPAVLKRTVEGMDPNTIFGSHTSYTIDENMVFNKNISYECGYRTGGYMNYKYGPQRLLVYINEITKPIYPGCLNATQSGNEVEISFLFPKGIDSIVVKRDGKSLFTSHSPDIVGFKDLSIVQGATYKYVCAMVVDGKEYDGSPLTVRPYEPARDFISYGQ